MSTARGHIIRRVGQLRSREVRATEAVTLALSRAHDDPCNAFVTLTDEYALRRAVHIDALLDADRDPGPLAGVMVGVKDVHDVAGINTYHGSRAFAGAPTAPSSSPLVQGLEDAGVIVLGKTSTSELEFSATSENPVSGISQHPTHPAHTPGGSSGGSAIAVATGVVELGTGTDGGGSLRIPAAACGLTALKLSPGHLSTADGWGRDGAWGDLTSTGVLASDLWSTCLTYDVLLNSVASARATRTLPSLVDAVNDGLRGGPPRLAWMPNLGWAVAEPAVLDACERAISVLSDAGAEIEEVDGLGDIDPAPLWTRFAATGTHRWLQHHPARPDQEALGTTLKGILERWGSADTRTMEAANTDRHHLRTQLEERLTTVTALLSPTIVAPAPVHADAARAAWVRNTYVFNLTGSPAGTLPVGSTPAGLPVGLQIAAANGRDADVVRTMGWASQVLQTLGDDT